MSTLISYHNCSQVRHNSSIAPPNGFSPFCTYRETPTYLSYRSSTTDFTFSQYHPQTWMMKNVQNLSLLLELVVVAVLKCIMGTGWHQPKYVKGTEGLQYQDLALVSIFRGEGHIHFNYPLPEYQICIAFYLLVLFLSCPPLNDFIFCCAFFSR